MGCLNVMFLKGFDILLGITGFQKITQKLQSLLKYLNIQSIALNCGDFNVTYFEMCTLYISRYLVRVGMPYSHPYINTYEHPLPNVPSVVINCNQLSQ